MALFSRLIPHQSRAADAVHDVIAGYPNGVTFEQLMRENKDRLKDRTTVLAAIDLLLEERKIKSDRPWHEGAGFLEKTRLYVPLPKNSS